MALVQNTRPAPFGAITVFNLVARVESVWIALSEWNARRKTRNALIELSDRELADIGLHRGALEDIPSRF